VAGAKLRVLRGSIYWVHCTPLLDPSKSLTLRTRSLEGLVDGRCSTVKAPQTPRPEAHARPQDSYGVWWVPHEAERPGVNSRRSSQSADFGAPRRTWTCGGATGEARNHLLWAVRLLQTGRGPVQFGPLAGPGPLGTDDRVAVGGTVEAGESLDAGGGGAGVWRAWSILKKPNAKMCRARPTRNTNSPRFAPTISYVSAPPPPPPQQQHTNNFKKKLYIIKKQKTQKTY